MKIQGSEIESTEKLNLLRVTIDSKVNFNHHISNVWNKASQRIGILIRLKNQIPTEAKLQLYKAAILPHLTYCHLTWHLCKASDNRKPKRIQERGLRAVFNPRTYKGRRSGCNSPPPHGFLRFCRGDFLCISLHFSSCLFIFETPFLEIWWKSTGRCMRY